MKMNVYMELVCLKWGQRTDLDFQNVFFFLD